LEVGEEIKISSMAKTFIDFLIERQKRKEKYFKNWRFYLKKIKRSAGKILGKKTKVFIFGSFVRGDFGPQSDIDVLIISENLSEDFDEIAKIRTKIKSKVGVFSPFQLHLAMPEDFESWYKKFIKKDFLDIK
jgi:predicted nucleotidyltransferase